MLFSLLFGDEKYDYKKFNLKANNQKLKGLVLEIKNGYEIEGEWCMKKSLIK